MEPPYARELRDVVIEAASRLAAVPDTIASSRPAPGKWSVKEIIGHLIDSAINNHGRFVRACSTGALSFPGYEQEAWVAAQRYADADFPGLLNVWRELNVNLARVMATISVEDRLRERRSHNLHQIAFRPLPADQPATLDYLMEDYVEHLKHHLRQIDYLV
jgi:hypothetical protein